ncbi:MAG: energy transducer TonB [Deltaproteobacteria bacterium]|nr:MAG: energy transducer TonB [Deltaproteobacteria bacterium]
MNHKGIAILTAGCLFVGSAYLLDVRPVQRIWENTVGSRRAEARNIREITIDRPAVVPALAPAAPEIEKTEIPRSEAVKGTPLHATKMAQATRRQAQATRRQAQATRRNRKIVRVAQNTAVSHRTAAAKKHKSPIKKATATISEEELLSKEHLLSFQLPEKVRKRYAKPRKQKVVTHYSYGRHVSKTVSRQRYTIDNCYKQGVSFTSGGTHKIVVDFVVESDGSVHDAKIASSSVDHPEVEACILRTIRHTRFPKPPTAPAHVSMPLVFSGGN